MIIPYGKLLLDWGMYGTILIFARAVVGKFEIANFLVSYNSHNFLESVAKWINRSITSFYFLFSYLAGLWRRSLSCVASDLDVVPLLC